MAFLSCGMRMVRVGGLLLISFTIVPLTTVPERVAAEVDGGERREGEEEEEEEEGE